MAKQTTNTTKIITGLLIVFFQATINRSSVIWCFSAECLGFNAFGLGLWAVGLWFIWSGIRGVARRRASQDK